MCVMFQGRERRCRVIVYCLSALALTCSHACVVVAISLVAFFLSACRNKVSAFAALTYSALLFFMALTTGYRYCK